MLEIKPLKIKQRCEVAVPGSKSYTHRILIAAALSDGACRIGNALFSEDTLLTMQALRQMGIRIDAESTDTLLVYGRKGVLEPCAQPIFLGNSGTSMRLLTAVAALGRGTYTLGGTDRMGQRPIQELLDALGQIGVSARSRCANGCPPVEVRGGTVTGDRVMVNCRTSSQYLSALLLIAPCTASGLDITVVGGPVSRPYVDMTVDVMEQSGVSVAREGYERFTVCGRQTYRAGSYEVEADCSQAGYFWAAAAITGSEICVGGISESTRQGDVRLAECLQAMGCRVVKEANGLTLCGASLNGIETDMGDMPDMVPTLAVVAAYARGTTVIKNIAHLRAKESDRIGAVVNELGKMGIRAAYIDGNLVVEGGHPRGAEIETYGDHRIAMSFAVAGLKAPGTRIRDQGCVEKSFPDFWRVFETLYEK